MSVKIDLECQKDFDINRNIYFLQGQPYSYLANIVKTKADFIKVIIQTGCLICWI